MKQRAENIDSNIENRVQLNQKLFQDYEKGKKVAAGYLYKKCQKLLGKSLSLWKEKTEESMISELEFTLQNKLDALKKLQSINESLGAQNQDLTGENEDLRQASIDGLEIANVKIFYY